MIYVSLSSHNRPGLLRLCGGFLLRSVRKFNLPIQVSVVDDASIGEAMDIALSRLQLAGAKIDRLPPLPERLEPQPGDLKAEQRLGLVRKRAVENFYQVDSDANDILVLLDDDILIDGRTLVEAAKDYEWLIRHQERPGFLTLHGTGTFYDNPLEGGMDKTFQRLRITGDAHILIRRDILMDYPTHFGPGPKGFADAVFESQREKGRDYFARVAPPYRVQHLGVGVGASAVPRKRTAYWSARPYALPRTPNRWIPVEGFDVHRYLQYVGIFGVVKGPLKLAEDMRL